MKSWFHSLVTNTRLTFRLASLSVQSLSHVRPFVTPWIAARQASLSITNSRSSLRFMSIESVMPSSHLILYRPLLLLPPIPPSIRVFSNDSTLRMGWLKYWSFSFSILIYKIRIGTTAKGHNICILHHVWHMWAPNKYLLLVTHLANISWGLSRYQALR